MNEPSNSGRTESACHCGGGCGESTHIGRRELIKLAGGGAAAMLLPSWPVMAGSFVDADFARLIPADKKLSAEWVASLAARGEPEVYRGRDLRFVGMPVGGMFCGTVYLGGDGRLWLWDIFNKNQAGTVCREITYRGQKLGHKSGSTFVEPPVIDEYRGVEQGFTIRVRDSTGTIVRPLDSTGFRDVSFLGQYPIGTVRYADPSVPVAVTLEAFSPFIPLNTDDSSLPATVFNFHIENKSAGPVEIELTGSLESAICRGSQYWDGVRAATVIRGDGLTQLQHSVRPTGESVPRTDIVFEDWSKGTYEGWQVQGEAFGKRPVLRKQMPAYQGDVGGNTKYVVNSHASVPEDGQATDDKTGRLTSKPFTISRRCINFWIGGGNHPERTCMNLMVDGQVVCTRTGTDSNRMAEVSWSVRPFEGKQATIEIVDEEIGAWGNIGIGRIVFSDRPIGAVEPARRPDFGTMCLALLGRSAEIDSGDSEVTVEKKLVGMLGRRMNLDAGASADIRFIISWHFPNVGILKDQKRHYVGQFKDAAAVAVYIGKNFDRLAGQTRLWRDTWYDSSLPYWFLDRTFANTSTLATTTCHRFADGRFWAWEGVGCCAGTCTHVWHYAQALARLFPDVERDQRERVDFGLALDKTGVVKLRAEHSATFAADGQAGRILGAYREHQMSADDAFLKRVWPGVRKALQRMMQADPKGNGLLLGPLHNTLDADWFGYVPWLCGMYHAALRAGEQMAGEVGDAEFAASCRKVLDVAAKQLDATCWSEDFQYYVHRGDEAHAKEIGAYDGCHIDQVLGQGWARQVGLGDVMTPAHVKAALKSIWKYNFTLDVGPFRLANKAGRWYAMAGDGGTIMVAFPYKENRMFTGKGAWSAMYFNECMSGFEHQAASHMIWEGLVTEGLAMTRVIHDRYNAKLRNPYNEIECSDHYARAMASYGTFLAACGFEYHGPKGHIGFAPRVTPGDFKAAFTAAQGWGTFSQKRQGDSLHASIELKYGQLRVRTISLALPVGKTTASVKVRVGRRDVPAVAEARPAGVLIRLESDVTIRAADKLEVVYE